MGTTPTKKAKPIRLCYVQLEAIFRNSIFFNAVIRRNAIYDCCYETLAVKMKQYKIVTIIYYFSYPDTVKPNLQHHLVSVKAAHDNQLIIKAQVSSLKKQDMQRNRIGLDAVISSLKLLARQGMPLRGHSEEKK